MYRLEEQKIITKSQNKINVAGKVDVMCFDKTGTLTEDSLDLYGVRVVQRTPNGLEFDNIVKNQVHERLNDPEVQTESSSKTFSQKCLELMATCHSLTYIRGVLSGDPLDLKMFNALGWTLKDDHEDDHSEGICSLFPPNNSESGYFRSEHSVHVVKRFEFVPKLQRMSCIVKDSREERQRIYVKGSPERIKELCRDSTIPKDFNEVLSIYTQV